MSPPALLDSPAPERSALSSPDHLEPEEVQQEEYAEAQLSDAAEETRPELDSDQPDPQEEVLALPQPLELQTKLMQPRDPQTERMEPQDPPTEVMQLQDP